MRVLSVDELRLVKGIPYSAMHLRRLWKVGKFPKPIKLGENRLGFIESEIDAWLKQRMAERGADASAA